MSGVADRPRRVSFYTVGCRLNQAETALLADRFQAQGYRAVALHEETDVFVVNTCSVTAEAEADCRRVVRRIRRLSPKALVAVTGCYAQTGVEVLRANPNIDLILGTQYKMRLPDYVEALGPREDRTRPEVLHTKRVDHDTFELPGAGTYSTTRANLKIQDGCQFMCAFCLIPFARGRERSRAFEDAVREAEMLAQRGHREVVLTGVNLGQYRDRGAGLMELIRRLEQVPSLSRIRISSIEPTTIPDGLLEWMASSRKLCRYLHLPLQSGDDGILRAMNRRYTVEEYRRFLDRAVDAVPDLCVGTDVMVGFPGEDEAAFAHTRDLIDALPFAYLHVFSFSARPGTAAARLPDQVSGSVIKTRSRELADLSRLKRLRFYQRRLGQVEEVLFETSDHRGQWIGLTDHYVRVAVRATAHLANRLRSVRITGIADGLCVGHLAETEPSRPGALASPMTKAGAPDSSREIAV